MIYTTLPYLVFLIILCVLGFYEIKSIKKRKIQIIEASVFILFWGFRGYIGTDWYNYLYFYENTVLDFGTLLEYEPFFTIAARFCKSLGLNYLAFNFLMFSCQVILFDFYFRKKLKYMFVAYICLFVFFPNLLIDTVRNFTAILLGFIALDFYRVNRVRYLLILLAAILFHKSAIVFLIIAPLVHMRLSKRTLVCITIVVIGIYVCQVPLIKPILYNISSVLPSAYNAMVTMYLESPQYSASYGLSFGTIEKVFILFLCIYKYREDNMYFRIGCYYIISYLIMSEMNILINRASVLLSIGYIYILSTIIFSFNYKSNRALISFFIFILCVIRVMVSFNIPIMEYSNILIKTEDRYNRLNILDDFYDGAIL